ncbi:MAG: hypothetical protein WCA85_02740 [Paraburkholderia sp.]|uniref:hypothetical protein n=1 Tax=Paraburkholderia sp. TaxID=1926495 RepID=UPI003C5E16BB
MSDSTAEVAIVERGYEGVALEGVNIYHQGLRGAFKIREKVHRLPLETLSRFSHERSLSTTKFHKFWSSSSAT